MTNLEYALGYLRLRLPIFPIICVHDSEKKKDEKIPVIKEWQKFNSEKRLPTEEQVRAWWTERPDAGIGLATGEMSGWTVIDVDADIDPFDLNALGTPCVLSGRGGKHYYFKYTPEVKNCAKFAEEHDIRNDGGFIVLPPTVQTSGNSYKWIRNFKVGKVVELPREVIDLRNKSARIGAQKDWAKILGEVTPAGSRNCTAAQIAGKYLSRFAEHEWETTAWSALLHWNISEAQPPLDERELRSTFDSIAQKERQRKAANLEIGEPALSIERDIYTVLIPIRSGLTVFRFFDINLIGADIETHTTVTVDIPGLENRAFPTRIKPESLSARGSWATALNQTFPLSEKSRDSKWPLIISLAVDAFLAGYHDRIRGELKNAWDLTDEPTSYLLRPFIEKDGINLLFGRRASTKTYLAIRMMMSYASGLPFLGFKPSATGTALFLDYESTGGKFKNRLIRLSKFVEGWDDKHLKNLYYLRAAGRPVSQLVNTLRSMVTQKGITLVVIDSAAKASTGAIEESSTATGLSSAIDKLGLTTLIIGHVRKGDEKEEDIFGSSFYMNDSRNAWNVRRVTEDDDARIAHVGLYHRKTNNDRECSPCFARVFFDDQNGVDVNAEGGKYFDDSRPIKERILDLLAEGPMSIGDMVKGLGVSYGATRVHVADLKSKGKVQNKGRGVYELVSKIEPKQDTESLVRGSQRIEDIKW